MVLSIFFLIIFTTITHAMEQGQPPKTQPTIISLCASTSSESLNPGFDNCIKENHIPLIQKELQPDDSCLYESPQTERQQLRLSNPIEITHISQSPLSTHFSAAATNKLLQTSFREAVLDLEKESKNLSPIAEKINDIKKRLHYNGVLSDAQKHLELSTENLSHSIPPHVASKHTDQISALAETVKQYKKLQDLLSISSKNLKTTIDAIAKGTKKISDAMLKSKKTIDLDDDDAIFDDFVVVELAKTASPHTPQDSTPPDILLQHTHSPDVPVTKQTPRHLKLSRKSKHHQ